VEQFLDEGHKVKITIMFRGREVAHPELGRKILDQVAEAVDHTGKVEVYPKLDGPRNMIMVLAPDKKAQAEAKKKAQTDAAEAAASADPAEVAAAPEAPIETPEAPAEPVEAETEA
jgi:translation initiation factor IF-3